MTTPIAFLIAAKDYNFHKKLTTPTNDVDDIEILLKKDYRYKTYPLKNPTKTVLESFFKDYIPQKLDENKGAPVLIYFAGHGIAIDNKTTPEGYLIPVDGKAYALETLFSMKEMLDQVELLPCQHLLLVLDCCFSGSVRWAAQYSAPVTPI
jgi:uncharacterized caspase-like protein